jgi:hypothetical protein
MKKQHLKICKNCGKQYRAQNIRGTYCSARCRVAFNRQRSVTVTQNEPIPLSKEQIQLKEAIAELDKEVETLSHYRTKVEQTNAEILEKEVWDKTLKTDEANLLKKKRHYNNLHGTVRSGGNIAHVGFVAGGTGMEKLALGVLGTALDNLFDNEIVRYDYSREIKAIDIELATIAKKKLRFWPVSVIFPGTAEANLENQVIKVELLKQRCKELEELIERTGNIKELYQLKDADGFVSANDVKNINFSDRFNLEGDLGEFLGLLDRNRCAITLTGKQGSGKTFFSYDLIGKFLSLKLKVACFSLEEGISQLTREKIAIYKLQNEQNFKLREEGDLATVRNAAGKFDVVVIDSWGKLNADIKEFDNLRIGFPNTIFVVIFQLTSGNQMRGGTMAAFDASVNIETSLQGGERTAVCTKNRFGRCGLIYLIDKQMIA